eukprot:171979-Chlamydomonas_euryale.AAC.2
MLRCRKHASSSSTTSGRSVALPATRTLFPSTERKCWLPCRPHAAFWRMTQITSAAPRSKWVPRSSSQSRRPWCGSVAHVPRSGAAHVAHRNSGAKILTPASA